MRDKGISIYAIHLTSLLLIMLYLSANDFIDTEHWCFQEEQGM